MKKSMLLTTIAMIVVVVVALSTATFAWFSSQTQSTISGTVTIESTKDYIVREYSNSAWNAVDKVELDKSGVKPVSPVVDLTTTHFVTVTNNNVDAGVENAAGNLWFNTDNTYTTYNPYTATTTQAIVKSFQVGKGNQKADGTTKSKVQIMISTPGLTRADLDAIRAMNVVLEVVTYAGTNSYAYVGTQFNTAKSGLLNDDFSAWNASKNESHKGGQLITASLTADKSDALDTVKANVQATIAAGAGANTEFYIATGDDANPVGLYRCIQGEIDFAAAEYKLINAYIWLDGYDAVDNMMAKAITVDISFIKGNDAQ